MIRMDLYQLKLRCYACLRARILTSISLQTWMPLLRASSAVLMQTFRTSCQSSCLSPNKKCSFFYDISRITSRHGTGKHSHIIPPADESRLDLFNPVNFFGTLVPSLSREHDVLRYSTAAVAAKQLGCVGGLRSLGGGLSRTPASTEVYPNSGNVDWAYKAANYYHQALANLQRLLSQQGGTLGGEQDTTTLGQCFFGEGEKGEKENRQGTECCISGCALAATSILHIYECLYSSDPASSP